MAALTVTTGMVAYPGVAADLPVVTMTASTPAGDTINIAGGKTIVIAHNSDAATPYDITILGEPINGRDVSITKELTAGQICVMGPFEGPGWATSAGLLALTSENAAIKYGAVRLR